MTNFELFIKSKLTTANSKESQQGSLRKHGRTASMEIKLPLPSLSKVEKSPCNLEINPSEEKDSIVDESNKSKTTSPVLKGFGRFMLVQKSLKKDTPQSKSLAGKLVGSVMDSKNVTWERSMDKVFKDEDKGTRRENGEVSTNSLIHNKKVTISPRVSPRVCAQPNHIFKKLSKTSSMQLSRRESYLNMLQNKDIRNQTPSVRNDVVETSSLPQEVPENLKVEPPKTGSLLKVHSEATFNKKNRDEKQIKMQNLLEKTPISSQQDSTTKSVHEAINTARDIIIIDQNFCMPHQSNFTQKLREFNYFPKAPSSSTRGRRGSVVPKEVYNFHSKRTSVGSIDWTNSARSSPIAQVESSTKNKSRSRSRPKQEEERNTFIPEWLDKRTDFKEICKELTDQAKEFIPKACAKPSYGRTQDDLDIITEWLHKVKLFKILPRPVVHSISEKVKLRAYEKNQALCFQGDPGDCLYIIFSGTVRCLVDGVQVAMYKTGDTIGQTALDGATVRTATLIASSLCSVLRLERDDYRFTMEYYSMKQKGDFVSSLKEVKIFKDMDENKQGIVIASIQSKYYTKGEIIYREGGSSEALYIIKQGSVKLESSVSIEKENFWPVGTHLWEKYTLIRDAKFSHLVRQNSFFGEIELLKNCKRLHNAVCEEDSQVLILNKRDFYSLLDPDDINKFKFLIKDSMLEDLDRMKKKVIDGEGEKNKMRGIMIKALTGQLRSLNPQELTKRNKRVIEPNLEKISEDFRGYVKKHTVKMVKKYEKVPTNLE